MCENLTLSSLPKTWILDLDGTIVKHNGYRIDGYDTLLPGVHQLLSAIRPEDMVVFITSRSQEYARMTEQFLAEHEIHYSAIIYGAPYGERIVINDRKPSGLTTAVALNTVRDQVCDLRLSIDDSL